jgi:hypothetical protein
MPTAAVQPGTFPERDDWLRAVLRSGLQHAAVRVALRIGLYLNVVNGQCNPAVKTIAKDSGVSERSVYREIAALQRSGWLGIQSGGGRNRSNSYVLKYPDTLTGFEHQNPVTSDKTTLSSMTKNTATKVADKKQLTAKRTVVADTNVSATGERESGSRSLTVSPGAPAPDGGARETIETLLTIWRRPYGENRAAAWQAFVEIYTPEIGDELIASARRWVAARPPDILQPLEKWLRNGAWKNQPPSRTRQGNSSKPSLFGMTLAMTRDDRSEQ